MHFYVKIQFLAGMLHKTLFKAFQELFVYPDFVFLPTAAYLKTKLTFACLCPIVYLLVQHRHRSVVDLKILYKP